MENVSGKRPFTDLKFNWIPKCSSSVKCWGSSAVYSQFPGCPGMDWWQTCYHFVTRDSYIWKEKRNIFWAWKLQVYLARDLFLIQCHCTFLIGKTSVIYHLGLNIQIDFEMLVFSSLAQNYTGDMSLNALI